MSHPTVITTPASGQSDINGLPELTSLIRVAFTAIAAYDYAITIPREWALYRGQIQHRRASLAAVLFFLIRYLSVITIVASQVGWFGTGFSPQACGPYHLIAPILSVLCTSISQIIISVRAYATSRKAPWVLVTLATLFIACNTVAFFTAVFKKIAVQDDTKNCTSANLPDARFGWIQFLAAMVFDAVAIAIASCYLYTPSIGSGIWSSLSAMMFGEGLIYFFVLTLVNVINLLFFKFGNISIQTTGASAFQVATMVLSERFILNLYERTRGPEQSETLAQSPLKVTLHPSRTAIMPHDNQSFQVRVTKDVRVDLDQGSSLYYHPPKSSRRESWNQQNRY